MNYFVHDILVHNFDYFMSLVKYYHYVYEVWF